MVLSIGFVEARFGVEGRCRKEVWSNVSVIRYQRIFIEDSL